MYTVRNLLLFLISSALVFACQQNDTEKSKDTFSISGFIKDTEDSVVTLSISDTTYESTIVNDSFEITVQLDKLEIGILRGGQYRQRIYAEPGENIIILRESLQTEYEGSLSSNYYAIERIKDEYTGSPAFTDMRQLYGLPRDSFTQLVYSTVEKVQQEIDTSVLGQDPDWAALSFAELTNSLAFYTLNYPMLHRRVSEDTAFTVEDDYFEKAMEVFRINDVSLLSISNREDLLLATVENKMRVDTPYIESDSARIQYLFSVVGSTFDQDTLQEIARNQIVLQQLKYDGLGDAGNLIREYVQGIQDQDKRSEINERIAKWEQLESGKEAPGFTAQHPDSTLISLKDLRGKVVYIDVWATWCGPCLRELPYLEKMHERFGDREDVALVSVSIDSDRAKWQEMVKEKEMEGLQLWIEEAWDSKLNEDYLITGIPRFILIDKKGNIVDADAPRPSSEEDIYAMIEDQL